MDYKNLTGELNEILEDREKNKNNIKLIGECDFKFSLSMAQCDSILNVSGKFIFLASSILRTLYNMCKYCFLIS